MKQLLCFTFFLIGITSLYAQEDIPPLYFDYDASGNQKLSALVCVNCPEEEVQAEEETPAIEEAAKHALGKLSWAPNPTEETLIIRWENTPKNRVTAVRVYNLSGKQIAFKNKLNQRQQLPLSFEGHPTGIYTITVTSSDGKQKNFKIIKK